MKTLRLKALAVLFAASRFIERLTARLDRCHLCDERAEFYCESCDLRHCGDHESGSYVDCHCCNACAPTAEQLQQEWESMSPEEREELAHLNE